MEVTSLCGIKPVLPLIALTGTIRLPYHNIVGYELIRPSFSPLHRHHVFGVLSFIISFHYFYNNAIQASFFQYFTLSKITWSAVILPNNEKILVFFEAYSALFTKPFGQFLNAGAVEPIFKVDVLGPAIEVNAPVLFFLG